MDDARRDGHEDRVLLAHEEFVDDALRGRPFALVVEHDLHHPLHDHEVVGLDLVEVPPLDDPGVGDRNVGLAEVLEEGIVGAHHLHQVPALVGDDLQRFHVDALDQLHQALPNEVYVNPSRLTVPGS